MRDVKTTSPRPMDYRSLSFFGLVDGELLDRMLKLHGDVAGERAEVDWCGRHYSLKRLGAYDIPTTVSEFERFWEMK